MGEVFAGRYELVDILDAGGAGTVWRAWDHREGAYRAAKVLRQSDSDSLLRFVRETSRHIQHPHVVAPYGWSGEDDRVLFTMPLVRGGSVATLLGDFGALPLGWSIELLRQMLTALTAVHGAGLVHRDVKPANLLLDATGAEHPNLRLSDFGAAARIDAPRLTHANTVIGTPGYFAPEQLRGADPDPLQDIYAAAVVALQMATGEPPTVEGALPEMKVHDQTGRELAHLLVLMTDTRPHVRPASAREALTLLGAVPGGHDLDLGADPANPVEIYDHIPELPEGWGAHGPSRGNAPGRTGSTAAAATRQVGVEDHVPSPATTSLPVERLRATEAEENVAGTSAGVPTGAWVLGAVGVVLLVLALVIELS